MNSYKFIIRGKVQGVFYRKNVYDNSIKENFSGYVKNLPDASVEACTTCSEDELDIFLNILKKGSPRSIVKKIEKLSWSESFSGEFEIRY